MDSSDPILDKLLSIEALCYGVTRGVPNESKVSDVNVPKVALHAVTALLGNSDNVMRIYKVENYLCNKIEDIRSVFDPETDRARRNICFLLETLTNAKTLTHQQLLTMIYAVATGIQDTIDTLLRLRDSASNQGTSVDDHSAAIASLQELTALRQKLADTTSGYQHTIETKDAALDALNVKLEVLAAETKNASEEISRLRKTLSSAENNLTSLQRQHAVETAKYEEERQSWVEDRTALQKKIVDLEDKLGQAEAKLSEKTNAANTSVESLHQKHKKELQAIETKCKVEMDALQAKHMDELKSLELQHGEIVNSFHAQLAMSLAQCEALKTAVQDMKAEERVIAVTPPPLPRSDHEDSKKYMEQEKMITDLQHQVHTYQHQIFELQHRDDAQIKELEAATAAAADLKRSLELLSHDKAELEHKYLELKETRYDGVDASPEANHRMNMLLAQCESYRAALMEMRKTAEQVASDDALSVQHTIEELQNDAAALRKENALLLEKVSESSKELTVIDSEVMEEQRKHITHLENQIALLKEQLQTLLPMEDEDERPLTPTRKSLTPQQQKITAIFDDDAMLPVFVTSQPILFIDVGCFTTNVGLWDPTAKLFISKYSCPSIIARPKGSASSSDLVRTASAISDKMYRKFTEVNAFVGNDAHHCLFEHPDAGLRGSLEMIYPMAFEGRVLDRKGYELLIEHCLSKVLDPMFEDGVAAYDMQVLSCYKLCHSIDDAKLVGEVVFDKLNIGKLCLFSEPVLSISSSPHLAGLIVHIGAFATTITPMYENMAMRNCGVVTHIGGEHCTELMECLLDAQNISAYKNMFSRRRRAVARDIKEKHAFVAPSFSKAIKDYGHFAFDVVNVMPHISETKSGGFFNRGSSVSSKDQKTKKAADIYRKETSILPDGTPLHIGVDRELFYAPEVLFSPDLLESCNMEKSIVDAILRCVDNIDTIVREEICQHVLLTGKTTLFTGLRDRLEHDLADGMKSRGVVRYSVQGIESPGRLSSATWHGAEVCIGNIDAKTRAGAICPQERNIVTQNEYVTKGPLMIFPLD